MPVSLITKNGTGRADVDTYVSLAEADAYSNARASVSAWINATEDERKATFAHACRILDSYVTWVGYPSKDRDRR